MAAAQNALFTRGHQFVCIYGEHPVEATVLGIEVKNGINYYKIRFGTENREVVPDQTIRFDNKRILNMTWAELKETRRRAALPVEQEGPRFEIGEQCLCMHQGTRYKARIVGQQEVEGRPHVTIHYVGYNGRYDEVIPINSRRLTKVRNNDN